MTCRNLFIVGLLLVCFGCNYSTEPVVIAVTTKPVKPPVERFDRARFPCTDSLRGIWRVWKYDGFGQYYIFPTAAGVRWFVALETDTMRVFQGDTLLLKQYVGLERLTPKHRQPNGYKPFQWRINTSLNPNPAFLQGYYVRFYADSAFWYGNYDDGPNFWVVRDCR